MPCIVTDQALRNYLEWLITPQNAGEQKEFADLVDDYLELKGRIPLMGRAELIKEINIQLKPFGTEIQNDSTP